MQDDILQRAFCVTTTLARDEWALLTPTILCDHARAAPAGLLAYCRWVALKIMLVTR